MPSVGTFSDGARSWAGGDALHMLLEQLEPVRQLVHALHIAVKAEERAPRRAGGPAAAPQAELARVVFCGISGVVRVLLGEHAKV